MEARTKDVCIIAQTRGNVTYALHAFRAHQGLRLDVRVDMCDKGIRLCTVAGKEGVARWWCLGAARHCRHTHSDVVHNTHADPTGPATTPHVHPSVTSMCDAITHAVRTR